MIEKISLKTLAAGLFFLSLTLHGLGISSLPLIDRDEPRFAEASREMLETGDFLIPHFNHHERYDKPPLFYWCQTLSYRIFGQNDFAARFPSAAAAALTALAIFGFGSRLYGRRTGFWAAVIFTTCAQTLFLAKAGVTDMLFAFFYTTAVWAGWEFLAQKKISWWLLFYGSLALGFLVKGPAAYLPLAALAVFSGLAKKKMNRRSLLRGFLFSALLIAAWAMPALSASHGEYFRLGIGRHVFERALVPLEHHGANNALWYLATLPFYFVTFFLSFLPWSWRTPQMIRSVKSDTQDPKTTYLLCQILCVFAVFSLLKTKLPHYTFPVFPELSILWARVWVKEHLPERRLALGAGFMITLSLVLSLAVFPRISGAFVSKNLAEKSAPHLTADMRLALVDHGEPSLVWYFRKYLRTFPKTLNKEDISGFMRQKGPRVCVIPTELADNLWSSMPPGWRVVQARGFNIAKGKTIGLTALIKPD